MFTNASIRVSPSPPPPPHIRLKFPDIHLFVIATLQYDRLIDARLLRYSYMIAGVLEAAVCMLAFFTVFWWRGIPISNIFDNGNRNWLQDSPTLTTTNCYTDAAGAKVRASRFRLVDFLSE